MIEWAYREATGRARVSAWSVAKERDERYRGGSTGLIYWSSHKEGFRKQLAHVYPRDGVPFFRYINAGDENEGGPGESLEHLLFKEAVASITHTRLSLGRYGDHPIRVTHAETEKEIRHAGGRYFADVYLRFESETDLGMKWSGEVYVEILNTHAVGAEKMDNVVDLRVPMVEVPIPDELLYQHGGAQTTDAREDAYRARIKRMLESPNGFLKGMVLSDPSSVEYLERELADARVALAAASAHAEKLRQTVANTEAANKALQAKDARGAVDISALDDEAEVLRQKVAAHQSSVTALRAQMANAETAHKNQIAAVQEQLRKSKKALTIFVVTAFVVLAVLMVVMW